MKIKRKDLIEVLTKVRPGLSEEAVLDQASHFIFDGEAIFTYNEVITVSQLFKTGIKGTVHANELYTLLKKIEDDNIDITSKKNELLLNAKDIKSGLKLIPEAKFKIPFHTEKLKGWLKLTPEFFQAAKFCAFSASNNPDKTPFTSLLVEANQITSCDNYRATRYSLDDEDEVPEPFLLSAEAANQLAGYEPVRYIVKGGWIHFQNKEKTTYSTRMSVLEYPDVSLFFKIKGEKVRLPVEFGKVLERSEILAEGPMVEITLQRGKMICHAQGDAGWIRETSKVDYNGNKMTVASNPRFLRDILKFSRVMILSDRALLFKAKKFQHVIPLMVESS